MNINYALSPYPALLENMVAKIYEASSPLAEVQSFTVVERDGTGTPTPGAGHQVPVTISFNGVDKVTHIVRLFTASANLLHEYDVEPTEDIVTIFDPIYFQVGDGGTYTPITGSSTFSNPAFDGLTSEQISICQEGFGFLIPDVDYVLEDPEVTLTNTAFEDGQRWYIFKKPTVVQTIVNDSVVGKGFGGFVDVVADLDYIPGHLRKLVRFSGTGNYTFPADAEIPIGYNHHFNHFGTLDTSPEIHFENGTMLYNGSPKSILAVPFGSTCAFTWDGTNWNCILNDLKITPPAGPAPIAIVGQGTYSIGNVPGGNPIYTITHGLGLGYAYRVFGTLRGTPGTYIEDNNVTWMVFEYGADYFKISMEEIYSGTQNLAFDYILVKS